jgi:hypothetical protein
VVPHLPLLLIQLLLVLLLCQCLSQWWQHYWRSFYKTVGVVGADRHGNPAGQQKHKSASLVVQVPKYVSCKQVSCSHDARKPCCEQVVC